MKSLMLITGFLCYAVFIVNSQNLTAEFKNKPYIKELNNGNKSIEFYIYGIQEDKEAKNIENYIKGYRGVESFTIVKENTTYKAEGTFYIYANDLYFKNLFKLININEIKTNNSTINIDNFNFFEK